jgi:hypothetical protein
MDQWIPANPACHDSGVAAPRDTTARRITRSCDNRRPQSQQRLIWINGLPRKVGYPPFIALERAMAIERPHDVPLGMPSPEALRLATSVISRRYVLPETMQHPQVRSECMRLAYLIQACGLASVNCAPDHGREEDELHDAEDRVFSSWKTVGRRTFRSE